MSSPDPGLCVVGLGAHARTKILPALAAAGRTLAGVVTSSAEGAGAAQRFSSLDAALAALPRETAYFLATPPALHAAQAAQILAAGADVIVEKPAFVTRQDAARITALSGPDGPVLVEAFMYRHTRLFERLLDFWNREKNSVQAISLRFVIPQMPSGTFRSRMDIPSSSLFDIGCYPLSLLQGLGIDMAALRITRTDRAGEPEHERVEITGACDGLAIFIEAGVGPAYVNEARFGRDGGSVTFAPIFYGRPGTRTITSETAGAQTTTSLEDHNGFEAMFAVQRLQWLETQLERNRAMVYQAAQLDTLGGELFSIRNNTLSKDRQMTLPTKSTLFENQQRSADARGEILSIVDVPVSNVSIITSHPGTIRSNHLHHEDFHLMYVVEGQIDYFFKDVETGEIEYIKVKKGDNIFTPSKELHSTYFPVKTVLIVSSKNPRDQETYERDTVREALITDANIESMLARYAK